MNIDPCMGSGHILVYAFDVLYEIYKTAGYSEREIPRLILQNNLYGLDIDDRAAQLASFALIMKARHYNRRLFREMEREGLELNLCSIQESNSLGREEIDYFCTLGKGLDSYELRNAMEDLCEIFTDAKEYGSILEVKRINFEVLKDRLYELECEYELIFADNRKVLLDKLPMIIKQAEVMSSKYEVCTTNPPYLGRKGMSLNLINYIDKKYAICKKDLFAIFILVVKKFTKHSGFTAMITQQSWMFISSYSELRDYLINEKGLSSLLHLGSNTFEEINGEVVQSTSFVFRNRIIDDFVGTYIRLTDYDNQEKEKKYISKDNRYYFKNTNFNSVCDKVFAYWAGKNTLEILKCKHALKDLTISASQNKTGNNDKYLRMTWEVNPNTIGEGERWVIYAKGGGYRKWWGNLNSVINCKR